MTIDGRCLREIMLRPAPAVAEKVDPSGYSAKHGRFVVTYDQQTTEVARVLALERDKLPIEQRELTHKEAHKVHRACFEDTTESTFYQMGLDKLL